MPYEIVTDTHHSKPEWTLRLDRVKSTANGEDRKACAFFRITEENLAQVVAITLNQMERVSK